MANLFDEFDSSSSESGDDVNKPQDAGDMLFDSSNVIPLSKHHTDRYLYLLMQ